MVERCPASVGHTSPSPHVPRFDRTRYAAILSMLLLPAISSCHAPQSQVKHETGTAVAPEKIPAPLLAAIPRGTNLLGQHFRISENGPEARLAIEDELLVISLDQERFIVQKISSNKQDPQGGISTLDIPLSAESVATYQLLASLQAGNNEVVGKLNFLVTALEERLSEKQLLSFAEAIKNRASTGESFVAEWQDGAGVVRGSATLVPKRHPMAQSLAAR